MPYTNIIEVESALIALSSAYPTFCELITLPNTTFEGKTTHAVRLGTQPAADVDILYLTGGVHAREWGSCEILVNLATDLCEAYDGNTGIGYGGKYYSASQVKIMMETMNIIAYACVNPDGRDSNFELLVKSIVDNKVASASILADSRNRAYTFDVAINDGKLELANSQTAESA